MTTTAFVFPGQGSQRVGMGSDLVAAFPYLLEKYYRQADRHLGYALSSACFRGPAELLRATHVTQPAVFLTCVATLDVLTAQDVVPDIVAGHSLGEYAAMVAAGVLDWRDGLDLVRRRGELMAWANARTPGQMAAIIGFDVREVEALCATAQRESGQVVGVANENDPRQVVVSGTDAGVAAVCALAEAAGAERVVRLDVGAPFHCELMRPVEDAFERSLRQVQFRPPSIPVIANCTADLVHSGEDARQALQSQVTGRVRWTQTLQRLGRERVDTIVEVGPGRVLTGFSSTTLPRARAFAAGDLRRLNRTLAALAPSLQQEAS